MPAAPRTARAVARAELTGAILDSANAQLAEVGPAALSVRAVARDLGMASSAVYRYFASRDELLTALLVQAFDDMGAAVEVAEAAVPREDLAGRWRAAAGALRDWARADRHRYALAYGSPVPGYAAPTDTVESATRVSRVLLEIVRDAQVAGHGPGDHDPPVTPAETAAVQIVSTFTEPPLTPAATVRALTAWAALFGHLSLELFGHMNNAVLDYDEHFAAVVDRVAHDLGVHR